MPKGQTSGGMSAMAGVLASVAMTFVFLLLALLGVMAVGGKDALNSLPIGVIAACTVVGILGFAAIFMGAKMSAKVRDLFQITVQGRKRKASQ